MPSRLDERRLWFAWIDALAATGCFLLAHDLRFPGLDIATSLPRALPSFPLIVGGQLAGLWVAGCYRPRPIREKLVRLIVGVVGGTAAAAVVGTVVGFANLSRATLGLDVALLVLTLVGWRSGRIVWTRWRSRVAHGPISGSLPVTPERPSSSDGRSGSFVLDETAKFEIVGTPSGLEIDRWIRVAHCRDQRPSLVLVAGEQLRLNGSLQIEEDSRMFLRYAAALPRISDDGLVCEISFGDVADPMSEEIVASLPVSGGDQRPYWSSAELAIGNLAGHEGEVRIRCRPGPLDDPTADWLALADFCIARADELSLVRARSFHQLRSTNELEHFNRTYSQNLYSTEQQRLSRLAGGPERPVRRWNPSSFQDEPIRGDLAQPLAPGPGESAYAYAHRLLGSCIPVSAPHFRARLEQRARDGGIRVLSLCSGAARIEASYAEAVGERVEWSLFDFNADLLRKASSQFAPAVTVDLVECDVNELAYAGEKWDLILCVSGLHHLVELERVIEFCHHSLEPEGELWSIGEYVGRNGNRLWPEARATANEFFRQLPDRCRLNRHTGQIDEEVPDNDYSVGCFEAIRSEDIEPVLDRWFQPIDVYRRNCFLWRLVNLAYSDNYDPANHEDRSWLVKAVSAELGHFGSGGRGTELFGVYRPRIFGA